MSEETIDSFLRGDLAGSELENFNQALRSDPKLQQEVSLQRDIVDSIKQYRHSQLKNRLNSIEVASVSTSNYFSAYIKLAASIGAVALLIGSYAVLTNKKTQDTASITSTGQISSAQTAQEQTSPDKTVAANAELESVNNNASTAPAVSKGTTTASVVNKADSKTTKNVDLTQTNESATQETVFSEEMSGEDESFASGSENMTIPGSNHEVHSNTSTSVVKVNIVKEKNILAYRFFNNELYLHGNFSNSPYELFELNNKPSKQLFLYFENNYYELVQGKTKVTTLVPITDKATLLQLAQLREH
ncbi:MAG: hypothetical protein ACTHJT_07235 [Cytophaga sp.]|uniref:hypothetical protein n=1 Tax=Cytophaga sp. TaxID=29535 RepID=UPI003F7E1EAB